MSRAGQWCVGASLLAALWGCGDDREPGDGVDETIDNVLGARGGVLDVRRSLAVTDRDILSRFSLQRVMDTLARDAKVKGVSGLDLFKQWWDTQNPKQGLGQGAHCDDEIDAAGRPLLNGYPYDCRPAPSEGVQASCTSFDDPGCAYLPIGLFNRFDLAPEDGSHCGEYRIIYAKQTGQTNRFDRNLVIFEAVLANPLPKQGLAGCRRIVEAWAELSWIEAPGKRADRLEEIYFRGTGPFPAVVRIENLGHNERLLGQVRTNQFIVKAEPPLIWTLREFKLSRACDRKSCRAEFVPVTVKTNPIGALFGDPASDAHAAEFQAAFLKDNVAALASNSLTDISMRVDDRFNSGQSHSSGSPEMQFQTYFAAAPRDFRLALWRSLGTLGCDITPEQLIARARTQTCAGCHQLSNNEDLGGGLIWPPSLGFVHVSEELPETVAGRVRYRISPLLTSSFLPTRARVMVDYLNDLPRRRRGWGWSVGGRTTH